MGKTEIHQGTEVVRGVKSRGIDPGPNQCKSNSVINSANKAGQTPPSAAAAAAGRRFRHAESVRALQRAYNPARTYYVSLKS